MKPVLWLSAAILALSPAAQAGNWGFLKYSAVSQFTEKDMRLFREAGNAALEDTPDGSTRSWSNPDSGAFGTIQPLSTDETGDTTCRTVEIFNSAGGFSGTSRFEFCRQPDGPWKAAQ